MFFQELLKRLLPAPHAPVQERRDSIRLQCKLHALMQVEDQFATVSLVNVTPSGVAIEAAKPLAEGQTVTLTRDGFGDPFQGKVAWCKALDEGHQMGLEYAVDASVMNDSWLTPALKQAGFRAELADEKRELVRIPGRVRCKLNGLTGETYTEGEMLDLSLGGALVESDVEFNEGLSLEFETFPLGDLPSLKGIAKVASSRESDRKGHWLSGLRFTDSNDREVHLTMNAMLASEG